ncbi:MAG: hypothetical protein ACE5HS_15515 [bacterium]
MKIRILILTLCLQFCFFAVNLKAQEDVTIVAPTSEAAEGLDLKAVSELFKDAENLEEFEKNLNDSELGINNLDLDEDGNVDFIRVVEEVAENTHVIILQVPLAEDEFQDVATIEVEKTDDKDYNLQVHGNEMIYGVDYYVAPTVVHVHTWPIIGWIYRPYYRPYRSTFYFGFYPRWWRPYRPVHVNIYHTRTVHYTSRTHFTFTKQSRVRTVTKVNYHPRTSVHVKKKTAGPRGNTTTIKAGVKKTTNKKTGKTTVKKGAVIKTQSKGGKKAGVKKGAVKKSKTKGRKKAATKKGAKKSKGRKNK